MIWAMKQMANKAVGTAISRDESGTIFDEQFLVESGVMQMDD